MTAVEPDPRQAFPGPGRGQWVLVTGGAGRIGRTLRVRLPAHGWRVRSLDIADSERLHDSEELLTGDIAEPSGLDAAMAGCAAVVHLAAVPSERPWPEIRARNIDPTYEVFDAARRASVRRVIYASSVHATGFSPRTSRLLVDEPPRPDTLYGLSKVFGEALGRLYHDRYGLTVVCVRIGAFLDRPTNEHSLAHWLSPDDAGRLFNACLSAPDPGYAVIYGRSDNTRGWTDLSTARALGYEPRDNAEDHADEITEPGPPDTLLGGPYTTADFDAARMR
jgi:uronate dehydrogenase